jgi:hypothetical protein
MGSSRPREVVSGNARNDGLLPQASLPDGSCGSEQNAAGWQR